MAKLVLKHEDAEPKEVALTQGMIAIGRLPDNDLRLDNPAVSGHHAKLYRDSDHYVIEDNNSLNGTYVNGTRVSRHALNDGDSILIGKHTLEFMGAMEDTLPASTVTGLPGPPPPPSGAKTFSVPITGSPTSTALYEPPAPRTTEKVGVLSVIEGKTDQSQYLLTSKMCVIGKSDMASIKLRGWFAPKMACMISKRDHTYVIAASEKATKVMVNGQEISGQRPLGEGDIIEVAKIKMRFGFQG